MTICTK